MSYLYLAFAIVSEVIGTSALKASEQFSRPVPSLITLVAFASAFYFLSLTLRTMPVGIAYGVWSACGVALVALFARVLFAEPLTPTMMLGIGLIIDIFTIPGYTREANAIASGLRRPPY